MRLTFLGTGTSAGVPYIGCRCEVCQSNDPHDHRLRCSAMLETETTRVLIDCGPDFRQQILPLDFKRFDGVLLTHIHYDHVGGIDDIRPFCKFGPVDVYTDKSTAKGVKHNFPYCFAAHLYPGVPLLSLHIIKPHVPLRIGDIDIIPFVVMHGKMPILGFRVGKLAYITDMKTIDKKEMPYLEGTETLVINALRKEKEHHSHQLLGEAIDFARRIGAKHTYFIHCTHKMGLHAEVNAQLPEGMQLAYDGQEIEIG